MPLQPRPDVAGMPQHLVQRGNDRQPRFYVEDDYRRYLTGLRESAIRYRCEVHAYVLMTNHAHLLVTPSTVGAVSRMMQGLGRQYVGYIIVHYRRTGSLWEGRYKSCLADTKHYLLTCYRYIGLNPLRAAMVADPGGYAWSSYHANALGLSDSAMIPYAQYLRLGADHSERCIAYRHFFKDALSDDRLAEIRAYMQQQAALRTPRFQREIEAMIGCCASVRAAHRPRRARGNQIKGSDPL